MPEGSCVSIVGLKGICRAGRVFEARLSGKQAGTANWHTERRNGQSPVGSRNRRRPPAAAL